eukprot:2476398-Rhodomonas_salina.3
MSGLLSMLSTSEGVKRARGRAIEQKRCEESGGRYREEGRLLQVQVDLRCKGVKSSDASRPEIGEAKVRIDGVLHANSALELPSHGPQLHFVKLDLERVLPEERVEVGEGDDAGRGVHVLELALHERARVGREGEVPPRVIVIVVEDVAVTNLVRIVFA